MHVRRLKDSEIGIWHEMRAKFWSDPQLERAEADRLAAKPNYLVLIAEQDADVIGFLEAQTCNRAHGILELGSDALIDNTISHHAHHKLGFHEVDRQISYAKKL
jgi:L-amino acid N-acyltransferase YncA